MSRISKGNITKKQLNMYFDEKLNVDTICDLTGLSVKTISKYYHIYLTTNKKKNIYCNNHIVRPDSLEHCKHIIKIKEDEIKYINIKFNRIIKRIMILETENEKLKIKNEKLTEELNKRKETFKIY